MFSVFPPIYIVPPTLSLIVGITLAVISIAKGKLKSENIIFAVLCIWWSIQSPVFISQHIITDKEAIYNFSRLMNFFYTYLPVIYILFIHNVLKITNRNYLVVISGIISFMLSLTVFTDYFSTGFVQYSWGYLNKGGIAYRLFGLYGFITLFYMLYCTFYNLKHETDGIRRLSNKYMLLSLAVLAFLTILNLLPVNGVDFYPPGNFGFIPLSILAYGVLRYRLLDIRSFLHITIVRILSFALILLPNAIIFYYVRPYFLKIEGGLLFFLLVVWFLANHAYIIKVQTKIDDKFYRMKYRLKLAEMEFNEAIIIINNYNDLFEKMRLTLRETLNFSSAAVFTRLDIDDPLVGPLGYQFKVGSNIEKLLSDADHFIDRNALEKDPRYAGISEQLMKAFNLLKTSLMIPLFKKHHIFQKQHLFALFFLSGSSYAHLTRDEIDFINNILEAASEKLPRLN